MILNRDDKRGIETEKKDKVKEDALAHLSDRLLVLSERILHNC